MSGDTSGIAAYYDNLSRFLDVAQRFGRGGGAQHSSTHRFLAGDAEDEEHHGPERLDLLVMEAAIAAGVAPSPRVLDAGCGLGGTIFRWQARFGGRYDGLTLSPEQHRRASAEAARRDISEACRFHLRSYQEPMAAASYDAAIAIESLVHSPDPTHTIANLAQGLAPGGVLLIVDDMPEDTADAGMIAGFKRGWRCPALVGAEDYRTALKAAGLTILRDVDWTMRLRPRALPWLKVLVAVFAAARRISPTQAMRDVLDSQVGGFQLEALYRTGGMRYRLLVARKPD